MAEYNIVVAAPGVEPKVVARHLRFDVTINVPLAVWYV
jgi:hypothetical protein